MDDHQYRLAKSAKENDALIQFRVQGFRFGSWGLGFLVYGFWFLVREIDNAGRSEYRNPKPRTLNHEPETANPEPRTRNREP